MIKALHDRPVPVEEALPVLRSTPSTLRSLLEDLPAEWLDFCEDPQAWSPRMALGHLIRNEQVNWIPRAKIILSTADERRFPPFDHVSDEEESDNKPIAEMLDHFQSLRSDNLQTLGAFHLGKDDYQRTAEHPALGTVTLGQLLAAWVVHYLDHTHQIVKSLAKIHTAGVGSWRQYLAILDLA